MSKIYLASSKPDSWIPRLISFTPTYAKSFTVFVKPRWFTFVLVVYFLWDIS